MYVHTDGPPFNLHFRKKDNLVAVSIPCHPHCFWTKLQVSQLPSLKIIREVEFWMYFLSLSKFGKFEKFAIGPNLWNMRNLPLVEICGRRRIVLHIFPLSSLIFGPNLPLRSNLLVKFSQRQVDLYITTSLLRWGKHLCSVKKKQNATSEWTHVHWSFWFHQRYFMLCFVKIGHKFFLSLIWLLVEI